MEAQLVPPQLEQSDVKLLVEEGEELQTSFVRKAVEEVRYLVPLVPRKWVVVGEEPQTLSVQKVIAGVHALPLPVSRKWVVAGEEPQTPFVQKAMEGVRALLLPLASRKWVVEEGQKASHQWEFEAALLHQFLGRQAEVVAKQPVEEGEEVTKHVSGVMEQSHRLGAFERTPLPLHMPLQVQVNQGGHEGHEDQKLSSRKTRHLLEISDLDNRIQAVLLLGLQARYLIKKMYEYSFSYNNKLKTMRRCGMGEDVGWMEELKFKNHLRQPPP